MKIGIPKETKIEENRVALTPDGAKALVASGHDVVVESGAGAGSGFPDGAYQAAGARTATVDAAWDADLVLKVKEPLEPEYDRLRDNILFTYLHLAGVTPSVTERLLRAGTTAVAYETVEDESGRLLLLAPMSAVAGDMAATMGSYYLAEFNGGKGMLLGKVEEQTFGKVVVIGDGVVGRHAARTAAALGADVYMAGRKPQRAADLAQEISPDLTLFFSEPDAVARELENADLVVGAVLLPGARAPRVVTEHMVRRMEPGSVIVDVSIDQGGCVETARPTTHTNPVYVEHGVIHYCVTNMPGAYPRTSTIALTNATLPYALRLAGEGIEALRADPGFGKGLNTYRGHITLEPVARDLGMMERYRPFE